MEIKIIEIDSIVFFVNEKNSIERVKVKRYVITTAGSKYDVETKQGEILSVNPSELYEKEEDIKIVNFNDFFYIYPILESNGLNGRGFPWSKQTFTYFKVCKISKITEINSYNPNKHEIKFKMIPFGIIESKELSNLNIPITQIKKGSSFLEDDELHRKTVIEFNKNIHLLFKKITYKSVNMNSTSCKLIGGGGFSFDPNNKEKDEYWIEINIDIENLIIKANLNISKIFPNIFATENYEFLYNELDNNGIQLLCFARNQDSKSSRAKIITKDKSVIPKTITYKNIKINCSFEKETEIEILKDSKIFPTLTIWDVKNIETNSCLKTIDNLLCK